MVKKYIQAIAIAGCISVAAAPALATYPVHDSAAFGKLIDQFNKLQEQFDEMMKQTEFLSELSKKAQDQINAIGKLGQVVMPIVNLPKLVQQINKDVNCLLPDFSRLMPGVSLDEIDWQSLCARRVFYETSLWFDPEDPDSWVFGEEGGPEDWSNPDGGTWGGAGNGGDWKNPDTPAEQRMYFAAKAAARQAVQERRAKLAMEAVNTGLAQSDRNSTEQAELNQQIIDEIEAQAEREVDLKDLLAALLKAMSHQSRMQVQQQQQMAQLIRIQANMLLQFRPSGDGPAGGDE